MSRIPKLLDTVIHLKRRSQAEIAATTGVNTSNLCRFLNGDSDIRSSSLVSILESVGIDIEGLLENEIDKLIGKQKPETVGEALETLLDQTDSVSARTLLDSLSRRLKKSDNVKIKNALLVVNEYKISLKSVRRSS